MTNRFAILCPGQGAQHAQMFDLVDARRREDLFARWHLEQALGMTPAAALAGGVMFANRVAQPLIVAAQMAVWSMLRDLLPAPVLAAGYSIGELSACAVAGAISEADVIALAASRARLMDACASGSAAQAMLALPSLDGAQVRKMIAGCDLFIAIETGKDSVIVGGAREAALELQKTVHRAGERACLLPVEVASHTPLMAAAAEAFARELDMRGLRDPRFPVLAGISAQMLYRKEDVQDCLARQIAETIRWMECMDACAEAGVTVALELGPGTALSRMMQARHPDIQCRSIADFRTIEGITKWVERQISHNHS